MPYKLDGNCVVKEDGTVVKCHPNKAMAQAHLSALMMNVPDAGGKSKDNNAGGKSKDNSAGGKAMNDVIRKAAGKYK